MKIMTLTAMIVLLSFSVSFGDMNYDCPKSEAGSEYGNRDARLSEAGNLDEAVKETRQAIKIDPDCSMWQQNLEFILEDKNKRDEANEANKSIKEIITAQEMSSKPVSSVYSYIAHIYSLQKDPKLAALYIGKAIDLNPRQESGYLLNELTRDFKDVSKSREMQPVIAGARYTLK